MADLKRILEILISAKNNTKAAADAAVRDAERVGQAYDQQSRKQIAVADVVARANRGVVASQSGVVNSPLLKKLRETGIETGFLARGQDLLAGAYGRTGRAGFSAAAGAERIARAYGFASNAAMQEVRAQERLAAARKGAAASAVGNFLKENFSGGALGGAILQGVGLSGGLLGAQAVLGTINTLRDTAKKTVDVFLSLESASGRVEAALRDSGQEIDKNSERLKAMSFALSDVTKFQTEEIRVAQATGIALARLRADQIEPFVKASAALATLANTNIADAAKQLAKFKATGLAEENLRTVLPGVQSFEEALKRLVAQFGQAEGAVGPVERKLRTLESAIQQNDEKLGASVVNWTIFWKNIQKGASDAIVSIKSFNEEVEKGDRKRFGGKVGQELGNRDQLRRDRAERAAREEEERRARVAFGARNTSSLAGFNRLLGGPGAFGGFVGPQQGSIFNGVAPTVQQIAAMLSFRTSTEQMSDALSEVNDEIEKFRLPERLAAAKRELAILRANPDDLLLDRVRNLGKDNVRLRPGPDREPSSKVFIPALDLRDPKDKADDLSRSIDRTRESMGNLVDIGISGSRQVADGISNVTFRMLTGQGQAQSFGSILGTAFASASAQLAGMIAQLVVMNSLLAIFSPGNFKGIFSGIGKVFGLASGGIVGQGGVQRFAGGGVVSGGTPGRDSVAALLTPGEIVLPAEVSRKILGGAFRNPAAQQERTVPVQKTYQINVTPLTGSHHEALSFARRIRSALRELEGEYA